MNRFAKVFERDGQQVVLMAMEDEECAPVLRFYCQPDGLGVCASSMTFANDDTGWDARDAEFEKCTEDTAYAVLGPVFQMAAQAQQAGEEKR